LEAGRVKIVPYSWKSGLGFTKIYTKWLREKEKKSVPIQQQQLDSIKPSLACTFIYVHVIDQITETTSQDTKSFYFLVILIHRFISNPKPNRAP
jgi:hypothetical protein